MLDACRREVEALHRFFQSWFRGDDGASSLERLEDALAPGFELVTVGGRLVPRGELLSGISDARGKRSAEFSIEVTWLGGREVGPDLAIAVYLERQADDAASTDRISSALFRRRAGAPEGVEWVHLHETRTES